MKQTLLYSHHRLLGTRLVSNLLSASSAWEQTRAGFTQTSYLLLRYDHQYQFQGRFGTFEIVGSGKTLHFHTSIFQVLGPTQFMFVAQ
jgi:hypothetical protein